MACWHDGLVLAASKTLGLQLVAQKQVDAGFVRCNDCRSIDISARAVAVPVLPNRSFAAFVCMNKPYTVCTVCSTCKAVCHSVQHQ